MSFVYDNEVKRLLGEERYSALINAVEVKAAWAINPSTWCLTRWGWSTRGSWRSWPMRLDPGSVEVISWGWIMEQMLIGWRWGRWAGLDKAPHIRVDTDTTWFVDLAVWWRIVFLIYTNHISKEKAVLLLLILHLNPPFPQVLSDWYKELAYDLTPDQAQGQLKTIFKHLNVVIPSISVSMAKPFSLPTNNQILQPRVADEEMEVSERKRLAFMVANTYKESKAMDPLLGTIDSVRNVKEAIKQYGFQVFSLSPKFYVHYIPFQAQSYSDMPFEEVKAELNTTKWALLVPFSRQQKNNLLF